MKKKIYKKSAAITFALMVTAGILLPAKTVTAAPADIGMEAAKQAAISHSGFSADAVTVVEAESDWEGNQKEYEIKFLAGNYLFKYEIRAEDGGIKKVGLEMPKGLASTIKPSDIQSTPIVTKEKAIEIALNRAGVQAADAGRLKVEGDYDDGILQYEVEFWVNGVEYSCDINAVDGTILSYEVDMDDDDDDDDWENWYRKNNTNKTDGNKNDSSRYEKKDRWDDDWDDRWDDDDDDDDRDDDDDWDDDDDDDWDD